VVKRLLVLRTLAFVFAVSAGYVFWWSYESESLVWPWMGLCFAVCAIGLWRQPSWAKNAVTAVLLGQIAVWILTSAHYIILDRWPYETVSRSVISLIPGALYLALIVFLIVIVRRLLGKSEAGT
jgi:UDP-N-acetylmuramyl pentapeptide phosphotransferase/UDP-N-acetylglucosamine-1-phosphate transferase